MFFNPRFLFLMSLSRSWQKKKRNSLQLKLILGRLGHFDLFEWKKKEIATFTFHRLFKSKISSLCISLLLQNRSEYFWRFFPGCRKKQYPYVLNQHWMTKRCIELHLQLFRLRFPSCNTQLTVSPSCYSLKSPSVVSL